MGNPWRHMRVIITAGSEKGREGEIKDYSTDEKGNVTKFSVVAGTGSHLRMLTLKVNEVIEYRYVRKLNPYSSPKLISFSSRLNPLIAINLPAKSLRQQLPQVPDIANPNVKEAPREKTPERPEQLDPAWAPDPDEYAASSSAPLSSIESGEILMKQQPGTFHRLNSEN
jgi:hypothetical protein